MLKLKLGHEEALRDVLAPHRDFIDNLIKVKEDPMCQQTILQDLFNKVADSVRTEVIAQYPELSEANARTLLRQILTDWRESS